MARPLGGRGEGLGPCHYEKRTFFEARKKNPQKTVPTRLEGGGRGKALLVTGATKKELFLRLPKDSFNIVNYRYLITCST